MTKIENFKEKPVLVKDVYYRQEGDNLLSIRGYKEQCYAGLFGASIFKLIKSNNTIEQIIYQLNENLKISNVSKLINAVVNSLCIFETNGIINLEKGWLKMEDGCFIVGESEYRFLSDYCNKKIRNKDFKNMVLPSYLLNYYNVSNLREEGFNSYQNEFIKVKDGNIVSCIFISGLNKAVSTCALNGYIFSEVNDLIEIFNYAKKELKELGIVKIKFSADKINVETNDVLSKLGFSYETSLLKEINGKDLLIYSCFIMEK